MRLFGWLKGHLSVRQKTLEIYRQGMARANRQDSAGAIAEYTAAIETPGVPADVRAMALYNRALVHSSLEQNDAAIRDLEEVLRMPAASPHVKTEANRRLIRMQRAHDHQHRSTASADSIESQRTEEAGSEKDRS